MLNGLRCNSSKILILFFLLEAGLGQEDFSQRFGFQFKHSGLYDNRYTLFNPVDILGDGFYTVAEFNTPHITLYNSMFATTDSLEALRGGKRRVKGIFGYTHQAYLDFRFSTDHFNNRILIGRDYLKVGFGKRTSLLTSDYSRPFDQVLVSARYKDLRFQMVGIQLENIDDARRFLALHTLEWNDKDKLYIIAGEALLYSGVGRSVEWQFFNPLIFWTPELVNNTTGEGNGFIYGAVKWIPGHAWEFWGELLIDDYQINRKSKGDLEPNELGFLGGVQYSGLPVSSSVSWLEYSKITNRTYQTPDFTEAYTHRGFPIGHYLGNDFDQFHFRYSQEIKMSSFTINPYLEISYIRDGANGLDTPFDTPWMDSAVTLETGYSEPFPTRPITYITETEAGFDYKFSRESFVTAGFFRQRKELRGKVEQNYQLVFRLWVELDKVFHY